MTTHTPRDHVWKTALEFSEGQVEHDTPPKGYEPHAADGFTKQDLHEAVNASDRVVQDVIETMVDYELLQADPQRSHVGQRDPSTMHETTVYSAAAGAPSVGEAAPDTEDPATTDSAVSGDIRKDIDGRKSKTVGCNICGASFETERDKNVHIAQSENHTRISDRDKCPECGEQFEDIEVNTAEYTDWDLIVVHERLTADTGPFSYDSIDQWCSVHDAEM